MCNKKRTASLDKRTQLGLSIAVVLSFVPAGCLLWNRLPHQVAVHFALDGQADGYASREFVVFGIPPMLAALQAGAAVVSRRMPWRMQVYDAAMLWITAAVSVCALVLMYGTALGHRPDIALWMQIIVGAALIMLGNYVPKSAAEVRLGRYTPRLHADDRQRIVRFKGGCLVSAGAAACVCAFLNEPRLWTAAVTAAAVLPWVHVWRTVHAAQTRSRHECGRNS